MSRKYKLTFDRELIYTKYMEKVNEICETCDWKSTFDSKEIVDLIIDVMEKDGLKFEELEDPTEPHGWC